MIELKSLHKFFNKGRSNEIHVINDITLSLPEKGMIALFGQSGCGKTTLLNVIGGLDGFDAGSLLVEGEDIRVRTDTIRNRSIGYIFQNYNLLKTETVGENVADALRLCGMRDESEIDARVRCALANVGMEKFINRTPDTLSGGQQQRVAIARAIVKNPAIILADEPTGNLDEANTVMVMDLLKEISRDRLVVLVTHEGELVDSYCDRVLELSDGRLIGEKTLSGDISYAARSKNDIWLGELEKSEEALPFATVEFFGEKPQKPIKLRLVNQNGRIYLEAPELHFLDETSEVRLREGVYCERPDRKNEVSAHIDMSGLKPFEGRRFGRLFTLKKAIRSGYAQHFSKKKKKGSKALKACLILFAAVQVIIVAQFGTAFRDIQDSKRVAGKSIFYAYAPNDEIIKTLQSAAQRGENGILSLGFMDQFPYSASEITFTPGYFETFDTTVFNEDFTIRGNYVPNKLLAGKSAVAGSLENLGEGSLVLTTAAADALLESSPFSFIQDYSDLIGLENCGQYVGTRETELTVTAVVRSDESLFYLSDIDLAKITLRYADYSPIRLATESPYSVHNGECALLIIESSSLTEIPTVGKNISVRGREFRLSSIHYYERTYEGWLNRKGIKLPTLEEYLLQKEPALANRPDELARRVDEEWFSYYNQVYYAHLDAFLTDYFYVCPDCEAYMAMNGYEAARSSFMEEDMYPAYCYREAKGRFPSRSELASWDERYDHDMWSEIYRLEFEEGIYNEYYNQDFHYLSSGNVLLLSPEDFGSMYYSSGYSSLSDSNQWNRTYAILVSDQPELCESFLRGLNIPNDNEEYYPSVITPDNRYDSAMSDSRSEVARKIVSLVVLLSLMSLCMYFMMRSSLMSRIREVGIYRAIGVSRGNLLFRFLIEGLVLVSLTVFLGFLGASLLLRTWLSLSAAMSGMFYYPIWLALALLILLLAISLLCSVLPVLTLLRRTPAQILAKYDI